MTIRQLIKASGYSQDYVATKIGLSSYSFISKIKKNNFSIDESRKIISTIKNEYVEDFIMLEIMRAKEDELTISFEQFEKEMGW